MWSVALRVGGCGRGGGWFAVFRWLVCGVARGGAIHDARCRNGTCGWSRCVSADVGGAMAECCFASVGLQRSRGGAIHDARCRNGTCGRSRCVSADVGGASVGLSFCGGRFAALRRSSGRHKWRPYVCGWLNVVSRRSSGRHGWRPYVCGRLIVVSRVVVGGVTRGCRGKGMGMKKEAGLTLLCLSGFLWLRRLDSNERPPGYEPGELPTAPLRDVFLNSSAKVRLLEISSKFFADFFPFF